MRVEETVAGGRPERVKTLIRPPGIVAEGVANGLSMPSVILQINGLLLAAPGAPSCVGIVREQRPIDAWQVGPPHPHGDGLHDACGRDLSRV